MTQSGLGGGPQVLRLMNCAAVLQAIRDAGATRLADLIRSTGLSRPTVTAAVATLIRDGWVEETEAPDSDLPRMGRPARVVRFRADAQHVVGIDVGPHTVHCAVADLTGNLVAQVRRDVEEPASHAALIEHVHATVGLVLARAGVAQSSIAAVGVGTPGIVDERRGAVVQAPSVPGWTTLELSRTLQRNIACPVYVENDVNLAVVAERSSGTWGEADDMVLIQWGARVGAAVLIQGRLQRGAHGAAGEIGFVDLEEEPQGVQPEGLGPLEATIGTSQIFRRARDLGDRTSRDAVAMLGAAAAGEPHALQALDEAAARFARGLAPFLAAIDPELVVIGGSITLAGDSILDAVRRHLGPRVLVAPRLQLSALGDDAVALGAVRLALDHAERQLLDAYSTAEVTT